MKGIRQVERIAEGRRKRRSRKRGVVAVECVTSRDTTLVKERPR